jgi:hypothetical protein
VDQTTAFFTMPRKRFDSFGSRSRNAHTRIIDAQRAVGGGGACMKGGKVTKRNDHTTLNDLKMAELLLSELTRY